MHIRQMTFAWSDLNFHLNKVINETCTLCVNEISTRVHKMVNAIIIYWVWTSLLRLKWHKIGKSFYSNKGVHRLLTQYIYCLHVTSAPESFLDSLAQSVTYYVAVPMDAAGEKKTGKLIVNEWGNSSSTRASLTHGLTVSQKPYHKHCNSARS